MRAFVCVYLKLRYVQTHLHFVRKLKNNFFFLRRPFDIYVEVFKILFSVVKMWSLKTVSAWFQSWIWVDQEYSNRSNILNIVM